MKHFFLFLLILFRVVVFSQSVTLTAIYSGSTTNSSKMAGDLDSIGDGNARAFLKFDLSGLSSSTVITAASLQYYNYGGLGGSSVSNSVFALDHDPLTTSAATLFTDCGDASPLSGNLASLIWSQPIPALYNTVLNSNGIAFLNSSLGTYALLALTRDAGGTNTYNFRGYLNTANAPKLVLTYYTLTPCITTPIAGTAVSSSLFPCTGEQIVLSLNGTSLSSGLGFQWQIDTTGSSKWTNITGATANTYSFISTITHAYRCMVRCMATLDSSASDSVKIGVGGIISFPYQENFEKTDGGWSGKDIGSGKQEWLWGAPTKTKTNGTVNGLYCWSTNLNSDYTDLSNYVLESPCLNFTAVSLPRLSFSMRFLTEVDYDGLFLEVSTDGGATWSKVPASDILANTYNSNSTIAVFTPPAWCGDNGGWMRYVVSLATLGGVSSAKVRVHFQSDNFVTDEGVAFDSVVISNTFKDLTVTSLISPVNACSPTGANGVKISVTNFGLTINSGTKIPVSYQLNKGAIITDTILLTASLSIGDSIHYSFKTVVNINVFGSYDFKIWVSLPSDSDRANDTLYKTIAIISVTSLPYRENFEISDGGWTSKPLSGTFNDFMWGVPIKSFIAGAASGTNCWITKVNGDYDDLSNYVLESPCIDLSNAAFPTLSFSLKFSTENNYDGCILESTINGGLSWIKVTNFLQGGYNNTSNVGVLTSPQWSGISSGWQRVITPLLGFAGQSNVKFRLHFASDLSTTDEGVAFDSITITDIYSKDIGVSGVISPVNGCGLTSLTPLGVKLKNYGKQLPAGTKFLAGFRMVDFNNLFISAGMDTITLTSAFNLNDSLYHTFSAKLNLSVAGYYIIKSWTSLANDSDKVNDTLYNFPILSRASINTFPYSENFEISEGTWYGESISGSSINEWDWNFPVKPIISFTPNGQQCWLTNPFNNYAHNSNNALYSPCFDFSALVNPEISFLMRFKIQSNYDAMVLESSINGGASWQRVDSSNFMAAYNNTSSLGGIAPPKWSGDNLLWNRYTINLVSFASQSNVQFRFHFKSDATVNDEGAAIDSVVIHDNVYNDLSLSSVMSPISKCGLGNAETVRIAIRNKGNLMVPAGTVITVSYKINTGVPVDEYFTFPFDLPVNGLVNYNFIAPANLSLAGPYYFTLYCSFWADINAANDTISNYYVSTKAIVSSFPYTENFAVSTPNWSSTGGSNEQWRISNVLTNPSMPAHSGSYMAVFNADSFSTNATSRLISPCFDFSSLNSHATLSFYMTFNSLNALKTDSLSVLISSDDGASWLNIYTLSRYQSDYASPQWNRADIDISPFAGQAKILIAFEALGKKGTNFAIDDISIYATEIRSIAGIFSAAAPCTIVSGSNWIDLRDDQNALIAQINPNGSSLGSVCYGLNVVQNTLRLERIGVHPNKKDQYYFVRNLWLQSSITPTQPVGIRLFYLPSEFNLTQDSVKNRIGTSISKNDFQVQNYNNAIFPDDLDLLNNDYNTGTTVYIAPSDNLLNGFNSFNFSTLKLGELSLVYRKQVTGLDRTSNKAGFRLYPNPTAMELNIVNEYLPRNSSYSIYNSIGQCVIRGEISEINTHLDIRSLPVGVYLIAIGREAQKFAKE